MPSLILRLALATALFIAGWTTNGWRWSARMADREANYAAANQLADETARSHEAELTARLAAIDAARLAERTMADEENRALRARVDAGAIRLRVAARCAGDDVPQAAPGASVDPGTRAVLDASARPDYFALRDGVTRTEAKLSACQDALAAVRGGQ